MIIDGVRLMTQDREGITKEQKPSVVERRGDLEHRSRRRRFIPKLMKLMPQGSLLAWAPLRPSFYL